MDVSILWKSIGIGLGTGLGVMLLSTVFLLPTSYIMNKFIYHNWITRILMGVFVAPVSLLLAPILWAATAWGFLDKVHYFGLFPILEKHPENEWYIMKQLRNPFYFFMDEAGYLGAIKRFLVDPNTVATQMILNGVPIDVRKGAVCEEFSRAAREAGSITDPALWAQSMESLKASNIGEIIFANDIAGSSCPPLPSAPLAPPLPSAPLAPPPLAPPAAPAPIPLPSREARPGLLSS